MNKADDRRQEIEQLDLELSNAWQGNSDKRKHD